MKDNILTFTPKQNGETASLDQTYNLAEVSEVQGDKPVSVMISGLSFNVVGYLSLMAGLTPSVRIGDKVIVSPVEEGVLIHGVFTPADAPVRASFGFKDDKLVIEAQGAVVLKSGNATVELTEAGAIRIDGKTVRSVAEETLTLLGSKVNLN